MPLTRFQIRNEYSLADPELYKAADKDDPEALLEGVAMAGLVGVLRQLGDLAEFAAEVFHDLHEEVISTAARGHGLMVRVQQLEAEVPLIEKAFLSQTSHASFFTSTGIDWHPNLRSEQSLITRGDLPRFVMDSYEECRGPPRLFLLDKFDVAGAGACLKRYTDPSVFKVESTSSEKSTIELQREKKIRKVKKKRPRWRNGGTPEVGPTSHTKLHQLFLEERIENCFNDPSRLVKLRKRQLNGCGPHSKSGKSYMEKFLETPSPEHKMVCETSVAAPTSDLISDNTNELGLKILDITMVSPASKSPRRVSTCSSCIAEEVLKPPMDGNLSGQEIVKMPESTLDNEIETNPNLHAMIAENQLEYDGEGKTESSVDGYRSDGVISEVDNYMDALATLESEIETDNERRSKNVNLLKVRKQGSESDANAGHLESQTQSSDSQSFGNTSGSEEGNRFCKRYGSSSSCSDTVSSLVDNIQYDSEGATKALLSIPKVCMVDNESTSCKPNDSSHSHESQANELGVLDNPSVNEEKIHTSEKALGDLCSAFGDSCLLDSIPPQALLDLGSDPSSSSLVEPKLDQTPTTNLVNFGSQISKTESDQDNNRVISDVPFKIVNDADHLNTSERHPISDRDDGDINIRSELFHTSNALGLAVENEAVEKVEDELLEKDYEDDKTIDKQPLPEIESCSSYLQPSDLLRASGDDFSDGKYDVIVLKGEDTIVAAETKYEDLPLTVDFLQTQRLKDQLDKAADDVPEVEVGLAETDASCSGRQSNIVEVTKTCDDRETATFTDADAALDEVQFCYLNNTVNDIHVNPQEFVTETVHPESLTVPNPALSSHYELTLPGDLDREDSVNYSDVATKKPQVDDVVNSLNCGDVASEKVEAEDVVDSENCSDVTTERVQADDVVDSVNCSNVATEKVQADYAVDSASCSDVATEKVQVDGMVASTAIVVKTATISEVASKNLDHLSDEEHASFDKLPNGTFQGGFSCDVDPTTINDVNEAVYTSSNGVSSTLENTKNDILENYPGLKDPYPNQNGFKDTSEYSAGPVIENKVSQLEVSPPLISSKCEMVSGYSDTGMINGIRLPIPIQDQGASVIDDVSISPKSLELRNLESVNFSHQSDLKERIEFMSSPPLCFSSATETPKLRDLQAEDREMEHIQADFDVSNSSSLQQSIKKIYPGRSDVGKVKLIQPPVLLQQDKNSNHNASEETIQTEPSMSELSIQYPLSELNMTDRTTDTLQPALPCFVLLPEVPQVNLNEMPPLPPLPPMQWRLGKVQQAFPALSGNEERHPSVLSSKADKKPTVLEQSSAEILQLENLADEPGHIVHYTVQPPPSSLQLPMLSNYNDEYGSATMSDKQSANPFLSLPPIPMENPEHDSLTSDRQKVRSDLNLLSPRLGYDRTCTIDVGSSTGQSVQTLSSSSSETGLNPDLSQCVSLDFEGKQSNPHVMAAPLSLMKDEQSRLDFPISEQEVASCSNTSLMLPNSEVGKPNGNPTSKLLRPRSPLIDAVAAHDKSKLRKVSDRILPQIGPKVDERDSLLAQIRTKSFNLKPAVVTRPSVQGPKTNLKVAAILEKANAIRQALAGSDEDDDDSWSDSE